MLLADIGDSAMAFGKDTLFSAVAGTVTNNGKPVTGARIVAEARTGGDKRHTQETTTDASGRFSLKAIERGRGLLGFLPKQFSAGQKLFIVHEGKEHVGWSFSKSSPEALSETNGRDFVLECDLTNDDGGSREDGYWGICRLVKR